MALSQAGVELIVQGRNAFMGGLADAERAVKGFGDTADQAGGRVSAGSQVMIGALRQIGAIATNVAFAGIQAFGDAVMDGITDAREAAKINAQTAAVIKSTGEAAGVSAQHVQDYAASLSAAAGQSLFGDDQIQESTNLLLTFTNIKGTVLDAATAISVDMAQALGGAPADAAIQLGKALNDPIAGISALTRVGVTFSDQQKEQIATMMAAGDVAGAQGVILAELNKEFGGSAVAAAEADGGWAQFNDRLGEAKETIGAAILPILSQLVGVLNDTIMPAVEAAAEAFSEWLASPEVQAGIADLGAGLATVGEVVTTVWGVLSDLVRVFQDTSSESSNLGSALDDLSGVWDNLMGVVGAVAQAYQHIIEAVLPIVQKFWEEHGAEIMAVVKELWDTIILIVNTALAIYKAVIPPILEAVAKIISDNQDGILRVISNAWTTIKSVIDIALALIQGIIKTVTAIIAGDWEGAWTIIQETAARIWDDIQAIIGAQLDTLKTVLSGAWDAITSTASSAWEGIKSTIEGLVNGLIDTLLGLPAQVAGVGAAIVQEIASGFQAAWDGFWADVQAKLQEFRDSLPFSEPKDPSSPLRGLKKSGYAIGAMLQEGLSAFGGLQAPPMVAPPANAAQLMAGAGTTVTNTYARTYNYSPTYGSAPRAPSTDFGIMAAFGA